MGSFLSLSAVVGKNIEETEAALADYAGSVGGGLQKANTTLADSDNCCAIEEANGQTTIIYPSGYLEWDDSARYISQRLNTSVFSFHIHDGDFWMYTLYKSGEVIDQFNPIPDYWEEISQKEINNWKGNASAVVNAVPGITETAINKYLVRWDLDDEERPKAYPDDIYAQDEWQLTDFMNKLKLPFPLTDDGALKGQTYQLWTNQLQLTNTRKRTVESGLHATPKPWWKFW